MPWDNLGALMSGDNLGARMPGDSVGAPGAPMPHVPESAGAIIVTTAGKAGSDGSQLEHVLFHGMMCLVVLVHPCLGTTLVHSCLGVTLV
jgi:hypothetical protein